MGRVTFVDFLYQPGHEGETTFLLGGFELSEIGEDEDRLSYLLANISTTSPAEVLLQEKEFFLARMVPTASKRCSKLGGTGVRPQRKFQSWPPNLARKNLHVSPRYPLDDLSREPRSDPLVCRCAMDRSAAVSGDENCFCCYETWGGSMFRVTSRLSPRDA